MPTAVPRLKGSRAVDDVPVLKILRPMVLNGRERLLTSRRDRVAKHSTAKIVVSVLGVGRGVSNFGFGGGHVQSSEMVVFA